MVALQVTILNKINSIQLDYKSAIARELEIFTSVKALILKGVIPDILTNIQSSPPTTTSAQCANIDVLAVSAVSCSHRVLCFSVVSLGSD